jgi:hypothetical protein
MTIINSVSPTASVTLTATTTSSRILIPTTGTPTVTLITNMGQYPVFLAFGDITVVAANGNVPLLPGTQIAITAGVFTYVAAITLYGQVSINITTCV